MNFFPDLLQTTALSMAEDTNVFEATQREGATALRVVAGNDVGYEAILYFDGRVLIGFQESWDGHNEKIDFEWQNGVAHATAANGEAHTLHVDDKFNLLIWSISGQNAEGNPAVLRYMRNFYDPFGALIQSIRYEEHAGICHQVYQFFEYGIDWPKWKSRKAWVYDYPYFAGTEEYYHLEIPADIMEFPADFEQNALENSHLND